MGLRSVPSHDTPPDARIDISEFGGEGAFLEFRAPRLPDYMPSEGMLREVRMSFPSFPDTLVRQILLMASCYIRQADEPKDLAPAAEFARLAHSNMGAYLHILSAFTASFPGDFDAARTNAKNDSAE